MPSSRRTMVAISHRSAIVEAGLRYILEAQPEFDVRPQGRGIDLSTGDVADVLVMDHERGQRLVEDRAGGAACRNVLIVALAADDVDVRAALEAGVHGYVLLDCPDDEIVRAARAVGEGRCHLCSAATLRVAESLAHPLLTLRESEVLALVSRGRNNKEVARALGISLGTVKAHMRGLLSKLGARCRTEALWVASQRGLVVRPVVDAENAQPGRLRPRTSMPADLR